MDDWLAWVSAGFAGVSALFAGVTIWWPWKTRPKANIRHRETFPKCFVENIGRLIVACGCRRPYLFVEWRNDGDGNAHAAKVMSDQCDVVLMVESPRYEHGYAIVPDIALLAPGESFHAILLPRGGIDLERIRVVLEYEEEPTRLECSRVSKPYCLSYRLPALRDLDIREKHAAWEALREACERTGYGSTDEEVAHWARQALRDDFQRLAC